jgi:5-aminopentanamidase
VLIPALEEEEKSRVVNSSVFSLCSSDNVMSPAPSIADLKLSLLQHLPAPGDIDAALARLEQAAVDAAAKGSSLLLTPECGITGYNISESEAQAVAFSSEGPVAQQIADIASRHSIAILYGFIELVGKHRYNSVALVDDHGRSLLRYRKTHLWGDLDRRLFRAGEALAPVITYQGWRMSTLICYDVEFPETVRALALAGAQLVLVPTALMQPFRFVADQIIPVRAAENQVFVAYVNQVGREGDTIYEGCSTIASPSGTVLVKGPSDEGALLHTTLHASAIDSIRGELPYHRDRRPELYASLASMLPE